VRTKNKQKMYKLTVKEKNRRAVSQMISHLDTATECLDMWLDSNLEIEWVKITVIHESVGKLFGGS